jgi:hypothetical protein
VQPFSDVRRRPLSASPFNLRRVAEPVETFVVDDQVSHDTYGLGRVSAVENETAVVVDFSAGEMRLTAPYPKLFKL